MIEGVVIVGAGQAGITLCEKLRSEGFDGRIVLIGNEDNLPYQRPPLSKGYLLGKIGSEALLFRRPDYYTRKHIELRLGQPVVSIDRPNKTVTLEAGDRLAYDRLVLATGASARRLPASLGGDLQGVFTIRAILDIDALAQNMRPGRHLVVIGGGYVGLEVAAVARQCGLDVTIFEAAPRILSRVASAQTAAHVRHLHQNNGVVIREGVGIERLTGMDGRLTSVFLSTGERVFADFVIMGIGAVPNVSLAQEAGLEVQDGIVVDAFGATSDPTIFAAGDCASFPAKGRRLRLESVGHAIDHAETVAMNLLGERREYIPKPWFWSDQYSCKLQIAGLSAPEDDVIERVSDRGSRSFWYFRHDQLVAVDAVDDSVAYMVGKRLIEAGVSPARQVIGDPGTNLKMLLNRTAVPLQAGPQSNISGEDRCECWKPK